MNVWSPTWSPWGDGFNPAKDFPIIAQYDYVKVWGYNSQTKGFDYKWTDDFNNFDYSRWQKSNNWSFDGNRVTFSWDNVYTMNSALNLRIDYWRHAKSATNVTHSNTTAFIE